MQCEELNSRLVQFPDRYFLNFDHVWKWKLHVEDEETSILDKEHIKETHRRLSSILPKWQTYRNGENGSPLKTLGESLHNISEPYYEIRNYSLLDFKEIHEKPLRKIWHELGRVKDYEGIPNTSGLYYAIAVCKPLLLIWGQTPAFDSKVRKNLPSSYRVPKYRARLRFDEWYNAMCKISEDLIKDSNCVKLIQKESVNRYGVNEPVPFGRFLDIYYWIGK